MSSSATRPSPATPRSLVAMDDWLNATSNALVALVFGVVVNGLFQMLMVRSEPFAEVATNTHAFLVPRLPPAATSPHRPFSA